MTDDISMEEALEELSSAEDFLDYFEIPFDPAVVQVNRLHIMQRFHDYLAQSESASATPAGNSEAMAAAYKAMLQQAYQDFVESDALTEKVFKVFKTHGPDANFVSVESLLEG